MARAHNDANVLCVGERTVGPGWPAPSSRPSRPPPSRAAATRSACRRSATSRRRASAGALRCVRHLPPSRAEDGSPWRTPARWPRWTRRSPAWCARRPSARRRGSSSSPPRTSSAPRCWRRWARVLTNKYAEGYPGTRYYGGCEFVDEAEQLAIDARQGALRRRARQRAAALRRAGQHGRLHRAAEARRHDARAWT